MKTIKRNWALLIVLAVLGLKYGTAQTTTITQTPVKEVYEKYVSGLVKSIDSTLQFKDIRTTNSLNTSKSIYEDTVKIEESFTFDLYPFYTVDGKLSDTYKSFNVTVVLINGQLDTYSIFANDLSTPRKVLRTNTSAYPSTYVPRYRARYIPRRY